MKQKRSFLKTVCKIAIPVALQSMLQASFSIVDQIMIGQLGSVNFHPLRQANASSQIQGFLDTALGFSFFADGNNVTDAFKYYLTPLLGSNMPSASMLRAPRADKILNLRK